MRYSNLSYVLCRQHDEVSVEQQQQARVGLRLELRLMEFCVVGVASTVNAPIAVTLVPQLPSKGTMLAYEYLLMGLNLAPSSHGPMRLTLAL